MRHDSWRRSISYSPKYIIFAVSQLYYSSRSRARCRMYEKMDRFTTLTKNKITQYNYDIFFLRFNKSATRLNYLDIARVTFARQDDKNPT